MQIFGEVIERIQNRDLEGAQELYQKITEKPPKDARRDIMRAKRTMSVVYRKRKLVNYTYQITRTGASDTSGRVLVNVKSPEGEDYPLVEVGTHGPGWNFGYQGSGPAQLAWSILAHYFGEANLTKEEQSDGRFLSGKLHQTFKRDVIAHLAQDKREHTLTTFDIVGWIQRRVQCTANDLTQYQEKREQYRSNVRLLNEFDTSREDDKAVQEFTSLTTATSSYEEWLEDSFKITYDE